jgi:uncharacterized protein (TIGR02268 family)
VLQPFASPVALACLLAALAATAQTAPARCSIILTGKAGEPPVLSLAPDTVTLLMLDAPIVRESVELEGRARFAVVSVEERTIMLLPAVALGPGERLALRFSYREGSPQSVVFLLTGQPGTVDTVVTVSRPQQPVEACRSAVHLSAARWALERCHP